LSNLAPKTTYYYKISRDPTTLYSFTTGIPSDAREPFEFTIVGDMHAHPGNNLKPGFDVQLSEAPNAAFGITIGDSIMDGNKQADWNAFFEDAKDYLPKRPLMNTTGNHDTDNEDKYSHHLLTWYHPYENPLKGGYYLLEYSNAVFFFIDSNNAGGWEPGPSDEQYEWLDTNLQKYAKKDKWIFLFMHHEIYSTGDFGCKGLMHEIYRPLAQQYHIDAIFYGHDHHYECFWVDQDSNYGGTLFCVSGGGNGQTHIDFGIMGDRNGKTKYLWPGRYLNVRKHGIPPPCPNITEDTKTFRNDELVKNSQLLGVLEPHFLHIRIDGDVMNMKAIGWQKQVFHHIQLKRTGTGRKFDSNSELKIVDY